MPKKQQDNCAREKLFFIFFTALFACAALVTLSYLYIDKPVAFWISRHVVEHYKPLLISLTRIPELISALVFLFYIIFMVRFSCKILNSVDMHLLQISNSVVIAIFIKNLLKIVFSRLWPNTWVCQNLSLLKNNAYGFFPFHGGQGYASFPSGHTTVIAATMISLCFLYPRLRILWIFLILLTISGLIGLNYHFVSDIIAGLFLGGIVAYVNHLYFKEPY